MYSRKAIWILEIHEASGLPNSYNRFLERRTNMAVTNQIGKKVRTTVSIPEQLYEEARSLVGEKVTPTGSINGFFVSAIHAYVKLIKRRQIDAEFAGMSMDTEYQREAGRISQEFSQSDWETFERAEKESQ
jgi:hypothetical protein